MTARVLAGLPHPRAGWPTEVSRWATSGTAPIDFLTCLTGNEVRALLAAGRHVDAVLLDAACAQVDPALVADVLSAGSVPIGIEADTSATDWRALGVAAQLPVTFSWPQLSDALDEHCIGEATAGAGYLEMAGGPRPEGFLVGVCGPGGTGASSIAMALAQATSSRFGLSTLLLDGARRAELAMYHDTGDVVPGLPELLDGVRRDDADPDTIGDLVFSQGRGYELMLGQRGAGDWTRLDRAEVAAALESVLRRWQVVVVDHDGDLEDMESTRSASMEARNAVSLELCRAADLWVIVAAAGTKGIASVARRVDEAVRAGVDEERIQVVFNRSPRSPAARAGQATALASTTAARSGMSLSPAFVAESRQLEAAHRDVAALPKRMVDPLAGAFRAARRSVLRGVVSPTLDRGSESAGRRTPGSVVVGR